MAVSSQRPSLRAAKIAPGHILVNEKFLRSEVVKALQENNVNVILDDNLGIIDFHPSAGIGVVYLSEAELVGGSDYRVKLKKLTKASFRQFILAEKTRLTEQYYKELQKTAVIELGFTLLPVSSLTHAAKILGQMVHVESRPLSNPYRMKRKLPLQEKTLLTSVQSIPGLGTKKALALLSKFHSIEELSKASCAHVASVLKIGLPRFPASFMTAQRSLTNVVGKSSAEQIKDFFSQPTYGTPSKRRQVNSTS